MMARITEQKLAELEAGAERFLRDFQTATDFGSIATVESSFVVAAQDLAREVRRLRELVARVHPYLDAAQAPATLQDEMTAEVVAFRSERREVARQ
jgi:hypothetical protein